MMVLLAKKGNMYVGQLVGGGGIQVLVIQTQHDLLY